MWKRRQFAGNNKARSNRYPINHDKLLFYSRSKGEHQFNQPVEDYGNDYLARFKWKDAHGYYRKTLLQTDSQKTLKRLRREDRLIEPKKEGANYSYKQYADKLKGKQIQLICTDIFSINPVTKERIGYPTQKLEALLAPVIEASSNEGDVIADFFAAGGTTAAGTQRLGRRWIACDQYRVVVAITADRLPRQVEEQTGKLFAIPDFIVEHWGV